MKQQPSFSLSEKQSFVAIVVLIVMFFIGILIPRLMAFLPGITGLGFFLYTAAPKKEFLSTLPKAEIIIFSLIFILAISSSLWAPNPEFAVVKSFKLLGYFITGSLLIHIARHIKWPDVQFISKLLIGLYTAALLFLISEKLSDHQLITYFTGKEIASFKLNRSFVVTALFSIPALFFVTQLPMEKIKKIILLLILAVGTLFAFALTESQTAQLCFIVGLFFLFIFPIKLKILTKVLMLLSIVFCLIFPFTIAPLKNTFSEEQLKHGNYFVKQASIIHRLDVWNYAAEKTIKSPIYGNGIESLRFMKSDTYMKHQKADNALHAHNAVLQIWAEFGIIGILLAIALLVYIFRSINNIENHDIRRLYLASFMACLCCSLTGYGIWQSWQLGLFFAVAAFAITLGHAQRQKD